MLKSMVWINLLVSMSVFGCKPRKASTLKDVAYDRTEKNAFIMFTAPSSQGADDLTSAIAPHLESWKASFRDLLGDQNFQFEDFPSATRDTLIQRTIAIAKTLGPKSTLVWYFNGHGENGELIASDSRTLKIPDLLSEMKKAGINIHRMLLITSACYSGKIPTQVSSGFSLSHGPVNEPYATDLPPQTILPQLIETTTLPVKEFFSLSSARLFEPSLVDNDKGDQLTTALLDTWKALKSSKSDATIGELFSQTADATYRGSIVLVEKGKEQGVYDKNPHLPMFAAYPDPNLLASYLFRPGIKPNAMPPTVDVDSQKTKVNSGQTEKAGLRLLKTKYILAIPISSKKVLQNLRAQPMTRVKSLQDDSNCTTALRFNHPNEILLNHLNGPSVVNVELVLDSLPGFLPSKCSHGDNDFEADIDIALAEGSMVLKTVKLKLADHGTKIVAK